MKEDHVGKGLNIIETDSKEPFHFLFAASTYYIRSLTKAV